MSIQRLSNWLKSKDNPIVCYLYHLDVKPQAQVDAKMKSQMMQSQPIRNLLTLQKDEGGFANAPKGFPAQTTFWALDIMARCKMSIHDEPVRKALTWIEEKYTSSGAYSYNRGGSGVLPCYVGKVARNVAVLAGFEHPSFQSAVEWLVDHQRFDHKETKAGGEKKWPFKSVENYGGCWRSVSCYHGVVAALRAFAAIPKQHRSKTIQKRIQSALRYLEIHRLYKQSSSDKQLFKHLTQFFLWGDYRHHLIDILETIAHIDPSLIKLDWIRHAVDVVDAHTIDGRVPLVKNYASRLVDPDTFESRGMPSRFLSLQWLQIKRCFNLV